MLLQDYIGNTPLVTLQRIGVETGNRIAVKLEGNNPAGSVKDRPAYRMIQRAEARGEIRPGDVLDRSRPAATPASPWPWSRRCAAIA